MTENDDRYLGALLAPVRVCADFQPAFGGKGQEPVTLEGFLANYAADPLYHWLGLDSPQMYAAHKAAGAMTSIYRQIGVGCEELFRTVVQDHLGLTREQTEWHYDVTEVQDGVSKVRRMELDARIDKANLREDASGRLGEWMGRAVASMGGLPKTSLKGAIFEVRQGYKSKDAKRQNADLEFGRQAFKRDYLPVVLVFSDQINAAVAQRYRGRGLLVLTGRAGDDTRNTYAFCEQVIGYSIADFFQRNAARIRREVAQILEALLAA